jgi:hypothetical protein
MDGSYCQFRAQISPRSRVVVHADAVDDHEYISMRCCVALRNDAAARSPSSGAAHVRQVPAFLSHCCNVVQAGRWNARVQSPEQYCLDELRSERTKGFNNGDQRILHSENRTHCVRNSETCDPLQSGAHSSDSPSTYNGPYCGDIGTPYAADIVHQSGTGVRRGPCKLNCQAEVQMDTSVWCNRADFHP